MLTKNRIAKFFLVAAIFSLFQLFFNQPASAQTESFWNKLSLEVSGGSYSLPIRKIVGHSMLKSPDHFTGTIRGIRASLDLNEKYSVGLEYLKVESHGYGPWTKPDTPQILAANGVAGEANGRTDYDLQGIMADMERRFLINNRLSPYLRVGAGVGRLSAVFNGIFSGHETQSGFNFAVQEVATDRVARTIPMAAVEVGLRLKLTEHLFLKPAGFFNTGGYGLKLGLVGKF